MRLFLLLSLFLLSACGPQPGDWYEHIPSGERVRVDATGSAAEIMRPMDAQFRRAMDAYRRARTAYRAAEESLNHARQRADTLLAMGATKTEAADRVGLSELPGLGAPPEEPSEAYVWLGQDSTEASVMLAIPGGLVVVPESVLSADYLPVK